jgi:hypothetical protein
MVRGAEEVFDCSSSEALGKSMRMLLQSERAGSGQRHTKP